MSTELKDSKLRIVFYGTPVFAAESLSSLLDIEQIEVRLVVTQPDRPAGRGKSMQQSPVKELAIEHNIPVIQPENIRKSEEDFLQELNSYGPYDLGVTAAFGQIIPVSVLETPKEGSINVHASLLPRWRGAAPIQRAIMAGDSESGVCLMGMEAGLDTGPVFASDSTPISESDTFETLHNKLAQIGGDLLKKHVLDIGRGLLPSKPQSEEGVVMAKKISKKEAKIDWSGEACEIAKRVRGLSPFPGAFTNLDAKRFKILQAKSKAARRPSELRPGSIHLIDTKELEIECGSGVLSLEEVQLEGKKRMKIDEFLRGGTLTKDIVLGKND